MPKDFYPELVRILRAAVWRQVPSGKGSHENGITRIPAGP